MNDGSDRCEAQPVRGRCQHEAKLTILGVRLCNRHAHTARTRSLHATDGRELFRAVGGMVVLRQHGRYMGESDPQEGGS